MPDATTSLSVLVAETDFLTASQNLVIAEQQGRTAQLQPAIAGHYEPDAALDVAVADLKSESALLDVFLSGSTYLTPSLRVVIAELTEQTAGLDIGVAEQYSESAGLDCLLSDAVAITLEPNRPRPVPLVTASDLVLTPHPNAIRSPTTDFAAAGIAAGDVLELTTGPNRAHYLIGSVQTNVLFVSEAFEDPTDTAARSGQVRRRVSVTAQRTCAVVLDQALFLAGSQVTAQLDVAID